MRRFAHLLISAALLAGLCADTGPALSQPPQAPITPPPIDDARVEAAGIRKLTSQHLVLYTDLPADPEVDRLPALFDQAVPQWAEYFDVDPNQLRDWQARGFLIKDRKRFDALGLMPPGRRSV